MHVYVYVLIMLSQNHADALPLTTHARQSRRPVPTNVVRRDVDARHDSPTTLHCLYSIIMIMYASDLST